MDKAYLIDMKTGETKDVTEDCKKSTSFYWEEGNMSCDCNRAEIFGIKNNKCSDSDFKGERFILITTNKFLWEINKEI